MQKVTKFLLDRNIAIDSKIKQLTSLGLGANPTLSRKMDGVFLKHLFSQTLLRLLNESFTQVEFAEILLSSGAGSEKPLKIPLVGMLSEMIISDIVSESDAITLDMAVRNGYVPLARVMNSSVGRRSGLVGVYADKATMEAILSAGGLNTRLHKVYGAGGSYPDNPKDKNGNKLEFFLLYPETSQEIITNFGVMPIK